MAYLQLAEDENPYNRLAEGNPLSKYIFIPAGMLGMTEDKYVREDFFDDLPAEEYKKVIVSLAPYQNTGVNGILDTAVSFIPGVGPIASKGVKIATDLFKKRNERVKAGTAKPIFKAGGLVDKIKSKIKGSEAVGATDANNMPATAKTPFDISGSASVGGTNVDFSTSGGKESFFTKNKKTILIGGGVLVGGILLYTLLKKKKR